MCRWISLKFWLTVTPMGESAGDGWERVPAPLQEALDRRAGGSLSRVEKESGVSARTIQKLLAGQPIARWDRLTHLAKYLGWPPDGFSRVRRGEPPAPEGYEPPSVLDALDADPVLTAEDKDMLRAAYGALRARRGH